MSTENNTSNTQPVIQRRNPSIFFILGVIAIIALCGWWYFNSCQERITLNEKLTSLNQSFEELKKEKEELKKEKEELKKEKEELKTQTIDLQNRFKNNEEQQKIQFESEQKELQTKLSNAESSLQTTMNELKRLPGERKVIKINGVEFAFRWCPPGTFMMGLSKEEHDQTWENTSGKIRRDYDATPHQVTLTHGFWIMETEVTQKQWRAIMDSTIRNKITAVETYCKNFNAAHDPEAKNLWNHVKELANGQLNKIDDELPMFCLTWRECQEFCEKCAKLEQPLALPTEAQWEYACRAGTNTLFHFGHQIDSSMANCFSPVPANGQPKKMPIHVKSYKPNNWGLYDMHGNVFEYCKDRYGRDYYKSPNVSIDPQGPDTGSARVWRGGSWYDAGRYMKSGLRDIRAENFLDPRAGFRCVLVETNSTADTSSAPVQKP